MCHVVHKYTPFGLAWKAVSLHFYGKPWHISAAAILISPAWGCHVTSTLSGYPVIIVAFVSYMYSGHAYRFSDVMMSAMASQITCVWIVCPTVYSGADQRKHQSPASLAFVRGIYRWPVDSSHRGPATRKIFPFDDVIMSRVQYLSLPRVKYEAAASYGCFQTYVFCVGDYICKCIPCIIILNTWFLILLILISINGNERLSLLLLFKLWSGNSDWRHSNLTSTSSLIGDKAATLTTFCLGVLVWIWIWTGQNHTTEVNLVITVLLHADEIRGLNQYKDAILPV